MTSEDKFIIGGLIKSCLTIDPYYFLPFLKNKNMITNMPNKVQFFNYYKFMIECLNCNSDKILHYKWKKIIWMHKSTLSLQIYDSTHKYPRLTFIVEKNKNKLHIRTLPF